MARDKAADALHRLYVAHANYEAAVAAKEATRKRLDEAVVLGNDAGLTKAEIARAIDQHHSRIHQILNAAAPAE